MFYPRLVEPLDVTPAETKGGQDLLRGGGGGRGGDVYKWTGAVETPVVEGSMTHRHSFSFCPQRDQCAAPGELDPPRLATLPPAPSPRSPHSAHRCLANVPISGTRGDAEVSLARSPLTHHEARNPSEDQSMLAGSPGPALARFPGPALARFPVL